MNGFLLCSLGIYFGTCLIWLIISYIYCHTHYDEFTIKEMVGFGNSLEANDNCWCFFLPGFNTVILIVSLIIYLCCFIGYIFEKIGNIKIK